MIAPVTALRISTFSTPNSFRDIFSLACANTSAYDVLAAPLRVTVTAEARRVRGSIAFLVACPGTFLATVFMLLDPGAPMLLAGITVVLFSLLVSPAVVVPFALFVFLDLTTVHSPSSSLLFRGITACPTGAVAAILALFFPYGRLGLCPANCSIISLAICGPCSSIFLSRASIRAQLFLSLDVCGWSAYLIHPVPSYLD
jgi:hypothetical protein